jgi:hypothetical protein
VKPATGAMAAPPPKSSRLSFAVAMIASEPDDHAASDDVTRVDHTPPVVEYALIVVPTASIPIFWPLAIVPVNVEPSCVNTPPLTR